MAMREAMPLGEGRELDALRRLELTGGVHKGIKLLLSRNWMEPGIFGIVRPVLIWPEGISGSVLIWISFWPQLASELLWSPIMLSEIVNIFPYFRALALI